MLRGFLRVLCELCVQTSYFFTGSEAGRCLQPNGRARGCEETSTAESAEGAEKETRRILGLLCELCGKTRVFHTSKNAGHDLRPFNRSSAIAEATHRRLCVCNGDLAPGDERAPRDARSRRARRNRRAPERAPTSQKRTPLQESTDPHAGSPTAARTRRYSVPPCGADRSSADTSDRTRTRWPHACALERRDEICAAHPQALDPVRRRRGARSNRPDE